MNWLYNNNLYWREFSQQNKFHLMKNFCKYKNNLLMNKIITWIQMNQIYKTRKNHLNKRRINKLLKMQKYNHKI